MKRTTYCILFILISITANAQQKKIDSLKKLIATTKHDTIRILLLPELGSRYLYSRPDSTLLLAEQALQLAKAAQFQKGEAIALTMEANVYDVTGNYSRALSMFLESLKISELINNRYLIEKNLHDMSNVYSDAGDERQSINYALKAKSIAEAAHLERSLTVDLLNLGDSYEKLNIIDSALFYEKQAFKRALNSKDVDLLANTTNNLGNIYLKMRVLDTALSAYHSALFYAKQSKNDATTCETTLGLAKIFRQKGLQDSAVYYARRSIVAGWHGGFTLYVLKASQFLTEYFEKQGQLDSAFHYQKVLISAKDSLFSQEKTGTFQNLSFAERQRQQDIQDQQAANRAAIRFYLLIVIIAFLVIMAFIFWRNNKQNKKARAKIEFTLNELKTTQDRLVQSAKMASLGELTAGIAHEIQNPLNFVNNFSEVNRELIEEMEQEIEKGDLKEIKSIVMDIKENEKKINLHGKRADSIVKGMLQHSRSSTGQKESTDINTLIDENLRLSYHGLRAKDKSFNADLVTRYDPGVPKINVIQQDMGRVLLNLFNNAFYAVHQKMKTGDPSYKPTVEVITSIKNGQLEIHVKDNGNGIPASVKDKIMQPFFTTKPAGEGTGLGLSLSYDIVVKGHRGHINVDSVEGEGSEFVIILSVN